MFVSVGIFEIRIPESQSLKAKRAVVRSVKDKLRRSLSVSVAEVGDLDSWQTARLGVTWVGSSEDRVAEQMEKCANLIERESGGNLSGWTREVLPFDSETNLGVSSDERLLSELREEFLDGDR